MKKWTALFLSVIMMCGLVACGSSSNTDSAKKEDAASTQQESGAESKNNDAKSESSNTGTSKIAVVYFSGTGNTKAVAEQIAEELSADIYEIEPKEPYTDDDLDYNNDSCRANQEMKDDSARPEIANDLSDVLQYDTIYIGHPIWWGTAPRIIQTFLDSYDLSGKTIYTFCTSGGSGIEQSVSDLRKAYPNLNIKGGYRFQRGASESDIQDGLKKLAQ